MRRAVLFVAFAAIGCAPPESSSGTGAGEPPAPCEHPRPQGDAVPFVDATAASGVDFVHHPPAMCDLLDTVGGPGVCAFDADGDGDMDLYFTDRAPSPNRLYRNDGGTFTDVTEASGAGLADDSHSCLAFDADGDGDLDLFVGNAGKDRLLRNDGGVFTDVTEGSGLTADGLTNTATAGDIDGDGDLDLFVGHSVVPETCPKPYCAPSPASCQALPNALYINEGGVFHEEAVVRGLTHVEPTLASLFFDIDGDGDLDLYAGNDIGAKNPDRLYRNDGTGHFTEHGKSIGIEMRGTDTMGVDVGDVDGDGTLDLVTSDFRMSPIRVLLCPDPSAPCEMVGINKESQEGVKWSIALVDVDHDTDLDIFTVAGNVNVPQGYPGDLPQLHMNDGKGRFTLHRAGPDEALSRRQLARGAAFADLDGDLDIDVVVANANGPAQVFKNQGASGYGLLVTLDTLSAGARVTVTGAGVGRTEHSLIGGGYAGSSDPRVHFGLGGACEVDVTVEWPGGPAKTVRAVRSGQHIRVDRDP